MNYNWVIENRASVILYNILKSIKKETVFILPANICPIVPVIFLKAEVKFIFEDISIDTLCIDLDKVKKLISEIKNPGLLYVRNMGIEHEVGNEFEELKKLNHNLLIVDDRCPSIITFNIDSLCSFADITLFSTGYAKYLDLGFGGLGLINNDFTYVRDLQSVFCEEDLTNLTAELRKSLQTQTKFNYIDRNWLGSEKLPLSFDKYKKLIEEKNKETKAHKGKINKIYRENIHKRVIPNYSFDINTWRFNIFCDDKNDILNKLFQHGFFASSHFASRSHLFGGKKAINSEIIHGKLINLFNNFKVSEEMALDISNIINKTLN